MNTIRFAAPDDAAALLRIYAQYIETPITFEYTLPSEEEFARRIRDIQAVYPYLVYIEDGEVLGYAYAHRFQERAAYQWGAGCRSTSTGAACRTASARSSTRSCSSCCACRTCARPTRS